MAAVKDTMKAGLLDMRQSLRASVGANLGIRHAMKSKFSYFLSEFSTATAAMSPPRAEAPRTGAKDIHESLFRDANVKRRVQLLRACGDALGGQQQVLFQQQQKRLGNPESSSSSSSSSKDLAGSAAPKA